MHPLIEQAKEEIREWASDDPRELAAAVSKLCRRIVAAGSTSVNDQASQRLLHLLEIGCGPSLAESIASWERHCRLGKFDLSSHESYVKLGIVTWCVKKLLKQLGLLTGSVDTPMPLDAWKEA